MHVQHVDLYGRVARVHHPKLNPKTRLSFAEGYGNYDWFRVIFSDEMCVWTGHQGRVYVRRPQGRDVAYEEQYCTTQLYHGKKVNVIGFFTGYGVGEIGIFDDNMNGEKMVQMFSQHLTTTHQHYYPNQQWYLLHDNDKKFHSKVVKEWLFNNGVTCLDFPTYSPDLNPIEHLWADLKRRIEKYKCTTVEKLKRVIEYEWNATDPDLCEKLVNSMADRCKAVIKNKGYKTKY